jgi:hypothetical protein
VSSDPRSVNSGARSSIGTSGVPPLLRGVILAPSVATMGGAGKGRNRRRDVCAPRPVYILRVRFKTYQPSLTLQTLTKQLRVPVGRLRFAVVTSVISEGVLKQALNRADESAMKVKPKVGTISPLRSIKNKYYRASSIRYMDVVEFLF